MMSDLYIRLRSLFRRTEVDEELDDELELGMLGVVADKDGKYPVPEPGIKKKREY